MPEKLLRIQLVCCPGDVDAHGLEKEVLVRFERLRAELEGAPGPHVRVSTVRLCPNLLTFEIGVARDLGPNFRESSTILLSLKYNSSSYRSR